MQKKYDVIVAGGGTAGCSCAWNCASLGLKTLLVEKNSYLGGAMTAQMVIPAMKTTQEGLNTDFFTALTDKASGQNAQITYCDGNEGWFNPLKLHGVLLEMLSEKGCEVILDADVCETAKSYIDAKDNNNISTSQREILSICIVSNYSDNITSRKKQEIFSKYFIDATGDGNLSKLCGAEFLPKEGSQAMSLRFIMGGVDKKTFGEWLMAVDSDRNVTTVCEIGRDTHFSTACTWDTAPKWALKPFFDEAVASGTLKDSDRAYFQLFSVAGETDKVAFNCPRIMTDVDLDPLSEKDKAYAKELGTGVIGRLAAFCRSYFKGFKNAYVYKIADEVGIRESRRVKGKYILTKEDIYEAKKFEFPVAYSNYPIDVHSVKKDNSTLDYVQRTYAVPLESLVVEGFTNLFVVGRCLSADFYAQAAVRIQPTCFSMGESIAKHIKNL